VTGEKALFKVSVTELTEMVDGDTMKETTKTSFCVGFVENAQVGVLVVPPDAPVVWSEGVPVGAPREMLWLVPVSAEPVVVARFSHFPTHDPIVELAR
jgi:hypothetical protein